MHNSFIWAPGQKIIEPHFASYIRSWSYSNPHGFPERSYGVMDVTRLKVSGRIAGEDVSASPISYNPQAEQRLLIDGQHHFVLRYERNGFDAPASVLGFNDSDGEVVVNHIQGTTNKVAAKVHALLDVWSLHRELLELNFLQHGVPVRLNDQWQSGASGAMEHPTLFWRYERFWEVLQSLCRKYGLN